MLSEKKTDRFCSSVNDVAIRNFQKSSGLSQQVKHLALYAMPEETAILFIDCPALYDLFPRLSAAFFLSFFVLCFFSFLLSFFLFLPSFRSSSLHNAMIFTTV
jgi:hypothetical protein